MKKIFLQLLFIVITLLHTVHSNAQRKYHFDIITEDNGLSDNRVNCFLKDSKGFLWIGTENGLNRFDGHRFRIYRPGNKKYRISSESISDIEEDELHRLWITTRSGLNVLNIEKDSLFVFTADDVQSRKGKGRLANGLLWDAYIDHEKVWLAADGRDLGYYDMNSDGFVYFPWKAFAETIFPDLKGMYYSINKIYRKSDHALWLGTTLGLFSFDIIQRSFTYHGGEKAKDFKGLYSDEASGLVYFCQENALMHVFDQQKGQSLSSSPIQKKGSPVINDVQRSIWIPAGKTLFELDASGAFVELKEKAIDQVLFEKRSFGNIMQDENGIRWIASSKGIIRFDPSQSNFHYTQIPGMSNEENGPPNIVFPLAGNSYIYASYRNGEVGLWDMNAAPRFLYKLSYSKAFFNFPLFYQDHTGRNWLLSTDVVFNINPVSFQLSKADIPVVPSGTFFTSITVERNGSVWLASNERGVFRYNIVTRKWEHFDAKNGAEERTVTAMLVNEKKKKVWVGDYDYGLFSYDMTNNKWRFYSQDVNDPRRIHSSLIQDIEMDQQGKVWVATASGGVAVYADENGRQEDCMNISSADNVLPENAVFSIVCDDKGRMWLSGHKGLTCVDANGKLIQRFNRNNGLAFEDLVSPMYKTANGEIVTAAGNGFIRFHPDSILKAGRYFPVVLTGFKISGEHLDVTDSFFNAKHEYGYEQNDIGFEFAALEFSQTSLLQYEYMLSGYDKAWKRTGSNAIAEYTNLGPGEYAFMVRVTNGAGVMMEMKEPFRFFIKAPFWRTAWFVAALLSLIALLVYLRILSLQKKLRAERVLNYFTTSLYGQNTIEDIFWDIAKNCMSQLKFEDCVIYQYDPARKVLVQKAAFGPKNPEKHEIMNLIEIPLGKGVVGSVAQSCKAEIIHDTSKDSRYIVDDIRRYSEITVPIMVDGKLFGVIDSEHSHKNFYGGYHLRLLTRIADLCSAKIGKYLIEEKLRAKIARDLHDEMGSTLTSINIISKVALERSKGDDELLAQLRKIKDYSSGMMESMSEIIWAINPQNDSLERSVIRMKELAAEMLEPAGINYSFNEEGELSGNKLGLVERKNLYLIFKEALNNCVKYSKATEVYLSISIKDALLVLQVTDNGTGFDTATVRSGNGLRNMQARAEEMNALFQIQSIAGTGTTVRLQLNIT